MLSAVLEQQALSLRTAQQWLPQPNVEGGT